MRINLITNLNGVGLEFDAKLVLQILNGAGHDCQLVQYDRQSGPADLNIFFEILEHADRHLPKAKRNVFIPNPEWLIGWHNQVSRMDAVWVKSRSALKPFRNLNKRVEFIGFTSRDMFSQGPKESDFFHLAGKSDAKNTMLILKTWFRNPNWPKLTVTIHPDKAARLRAFNSRDNINIIGRYLTNEQLRAEMNSHLFHLCPSRVEGWGHYLVEGMSTGAIVITTDGPPMNEHIQPDRGILIEPNGQEVMRKAFAYKVDYGRLTDGVKKALALSGAEILAMRRAARLHFSRIDAEFRALLVDKVGGMVWK